MGANVVDEFGGYGEGSGGDPILQPDGNVIFIIVVGTARRSGVGNGADGNNGVINGQQRSNDDCSPR